MVTALALAFSLPASALDVTVNFSAQSGTMNRVASGFLHPLGKQDPLPQTEIDTTAAYVTDLKIQTVRCEIEEVNEHLARFPNAVVIGTLSGNWSKPGMNSASPNGEAPWEGESGTGTATNPDWNKWLNYVGGHINAIPVEMTSRVIIDFWNEPNLPQNWSNWHPAERTNNAYPLFKECWRRTFNRIRALRPNMKVTAPGVCQPQQMDAFLKGFISYCGSNACVPDTWNWHFGADNMANQANTYRNHANDNGAANSGVMLLEYVGSGVSPFPGRTAFDIALIEQGNYLRAAHSRWPETTEIGHTLFRDTPTSTVWKKHGIHHIYSFYGLMTGTRLATNFTGTETVNYVGAIDGSTDTARILLGSHEITATNLGTVNLKLSNVAIAGTFQQLRVRIYRIAYGNGGEVASVSQVTTIPEYYSVSPTNTVSVSGFAWADARDAYQVVVNRVEAVMTP